jgi:hypothetical protein
MSTLAFMRSVVIVATLAVACLCAYAANVNARIRGVVTDPQDAVVPGAQVTATNTATGIKYTAVSGRDGGYFFPELPIGPYSISATSQGFRNFSATGIVLNIDQEYVEPIRLKIGSAAEVVEVTESSVQVDTTDMQFSNVVDSQQMTELPLIGRNFANLELTLPGVQSASGAERVGGPSVSGSQEQQSAFTINGADTNDIALNTQMFAPILDAVGEFNLIDGPLNAEYDRNSGGIVSATIKSGTGKYHGDAFDFYRDTFLNTNNFFQKKVSGAYTKVSPFHQHIVGGTVGGPILKNKLFIFGAFQASPARTPQGAGSVTLYTKANLTNGDFSQDVLGTGPTKKPFSNNPIPSTITITGCNAGQTWSQCLGSTKFNNAGGLNGIVPTTAFNTAITALVTKYASPSLINSGTTGYLFNETTITTAYQENGRVDFNPTSKDQVSFIGIYVFSNAANTLPFTGATVPGFGDGTIAHVQQYSLDYVRQISSTAVNDLGLHWTRFNDKSSFPQSTEAPSTAGFSITPQDPGSATIPKLAVTGFFTLGGTNNGPQPRIDANYQIEDNFSKTFGNHSLKFGYDGRRFNVSSTFDASNSGSYSFSNTSSSKYSTGDPSLDLLLGIPASYSQGTGSKIQVSAFLNYFYGQDTWKASSDLTINFGLGYSIDTPMLNHMYGGLGVACFIIGEQSKIFPGSPQNLVYPGDPGCSNSGQAVKHFDEFGPRIGFAWSPDLGAISGGKGKFSVRGGFGIYYNRTEEESSLQTLGTPPFGFTSSGAADKSGSPSLINPFADINGGVALSESNRFPYAQPVAGSAISFAQYEPITNISGFSPTFRAPYAENFQLSIERELPSKLVARVSYVGSLGRRNQTAVEGNYETTAGHAACLANPTCIADQNTQALNFPANKIGDSAGIAEMGLVGSEASSSYNALQASLVKGQTHGLLFQLSYTYSHSLDTGSSFENTGFGNSGERGYNQYQPNLNYGDSSYDARQRLVFSPVYTVPFKHGSSEFSPYNLAVSGWQISGITSLATGFPYDISYGGYGSSASLYCDVNDPSYYACPDIPIQIAPLARVNPRVRDSQTGFGTWYNGSTSYFIDEKTGSFGNIHRNPYHGPGTNNTNIVLAKNFSLSSDGGRYLQVRMESDNAFNHTQFTNPDGQMGDTTFGQITSAANARQTQLAAKIVF